jgi:hypothetical protein
VNDPVLHEVFVRWPAWQELHTHLLSTDCRTSDPCDLAGPLCAYGLDRAACLLYAHCIGSCLADSHAIVVELLRNAQQGRRPRFGAELNLRAEDFGISS